MLLLPLSFLLLTAPVITADGPTTFCEGESVTLTSSPGTAYLWSPNGETTQSITVLTAGSYYVTVTDINGTEVSSPVDVVVNSNPDLPVLTPNGPLTFCEGGSVTLTSSVADGYLWAPNDETTQSITVSTSGSYAVIIYHQNGCRGNSDTLEVVVNNNPAPLITPNGSTIFCDGDSLELSSSYATGNLWSNGETTQEITISAAGGYTVTASDLNGCSGISSSIHIEVLALPAVSVTANGSTNLCEGDSVTLIATATNADAYQWFRNGFELIGAENTEHIVSDFANYTVTVTNQNGCSNSSAPIPVQVSPIPYAYAGMDETICPGDSIILTAVNGGENFLWSNGATTQSITVLPSVNTEFIVSVSNPFCSQVDTDTILVNIADLPVVEAIAEGNFSPGNSVEFSNVSGDSSIATWLWDFGDGSNSAVPDAQHSYDAEGNYTIILTVENQYSCSVSDTLEITLMQTILIPNVITPNGDGENDIFEIKNNGATLYTISIFNRWGEVMYEREAPEISWGATNGSGSVLVAGTYYYVLSIKNQGSLGDFNQKGFITLIR